MNNFENSLKHTDGRIRFYMETEYNEDGSMICKVMERPKPYNTAVCVDTFKHEWRAVKRVEELQKEAKERGESIAYTGSVDSWWG